MGILKTVKDFVAENTGKVLMVGTIVLGAGASYLESKNNSRVAKESAEETAREAVADYFRNNEPEVIEAEVIDEQ